MKQKIAIIFSLVLIVGLLWTGSAFAQELDQDGSPNTLEETEEPEGGLEESNPVCEGLVEHPVLAWIESQYDVEFEDLQTYFCDYDFGIGEIVMMLESHARTEEEISLEDILAMRMDEELGWGEIKQSLGLIGKGRNKDDSEETDGTEALVRNENRAKFNHQTANEGEDDELRNGNKPETPPGQDKDKTPNNFGHPGGKDKDKNNPGKGKKP